MTTEIPHDETGCPDLQALVRLRGEQYAESIGEKYDPQRCPHHGGHQHITPEDWRAWDGAVAEWRQGRRDRLCRDLEVSKRRQHRLHRDSGKERRAGAIRRMRGEK